MRFLTSGYRGLLPAPGLILPLLRRGSRYWKCPGYVRLSACRGAYCERKVRDTIGPWSNAFEQALLGLPIILDTLPRAVLPTATKNVKKRTDRADLDCGDGASLFAWSRTASGVRRAWSQIF
jgi:hypothetical protein